MINPSSSPSPLRQFGGGPALVQLLNLPNLLTLLRIFAIPIFLALLTKHHYRDALLLFAMCALTDALDGTVARWFDARTELGAFLDPFADKLLLVSAFVVLTIEAAIPAWLLGVVIIRDVVIVSGYFMLAFFTGERVPVRPTYLGKASTFMQIACVIGALARLGSVAERYWYGVLYLTLAVTALSGVHYAWRGLVWLSSREPAMFE